ncbi:MAG: hypothetical protein HYX49_05985 [Chloroflexi bacterium]|nr:hypothetical protein [Chloroflexota bacterium]
MSKIFLTNWARKIKYDDVIIFTIGILLALILRISLLDFKSYDFLKVMKGWYLNIYQQGFSSFQTGFSNYAPSYLYVLYIIARFFPDTQPQVAIKVPSLIADFIGAWFIYKIVLLKYKDGPIPMFAALASLFAPTVILNGAVWGQIDSVYTAALIACLYFLLLKKDFFALTAFSIAFSIKFQAVFLAPLILILLLKQLVPWKYILLVPFVYFLTIIPAWITGRPLFDLITIYFVQIDRYGELVLNAPNIYNWFPNTSYLNKFLYPAGLIIAASMIFLFVAFVYKSRAKLTHEIIILLSLLSVLLPPYFLPRIHDRYFFPADVISIIFGFYFPKYFYIPIVISMTSFFSYQPFLFNLEIVPMPLLALGLFIIIIILMRHAASLLYTTLTEEKGCLTSSTDIL